MLSNCLLHICVCMYRLVMLSSSKLIFCISQRLVQRLITVARLFSAHFYMRYLYQLSPGLGASWKRGEKECKSQGTGRNVVTCLRSSGYVHCVHQLPAAVVIHTWSSQATLQHVWVRGLGDFTPSWGATGDAWLLGKGDSFFFRVLPAGRLPMLWGMAPNPYACRKH